MKEKHKLEEFVKKVEDRTNDILDDSLMDEDAKSENYNINYTDIVKNSTKARISKLPWLISIFLILIIAIILCVMFFSNNPKTLLTQTVDGLFDYLEGSINENVYDVTDGNISLDIKSDDELYNVIKLDADYVKDNMNGMVYTDLNVSDLEGDIPLKAYSNGENTYVSLSSLSDKYIKMNSNPLSYFINGSDGIIILKGLNQAFDKVISSEKIYGKRKTIDGEKVYEMRLLIDEKNKDRISENFINTLKANDEFISVLSNMKGVSVKEIIDSIDNYLDKFKEFLKKHDSLEVKICILDDSKDFIRMDILGNDLEVSFIKKDDKYSYQILDKDTILEGDILFTVNDSKTKYTLDISSSKNVSGKKSFSTISLKYTSKKALNFNDDLIDIQNNEMSEIEKMDIYARMFDDPLYSKFLSMALNLK